MKRLLIIISIILLFATGAIAVVAFVVARPNSQTNAVQSSGQQPLVTSDNNDVEQNRQAQQSTQTAIISPIEIPRLETLTQEEQQKRQLEEMVASFVERFGTYSNQNTVSRLESLKIFMSDRFYAWAVQNMAKAFPSSEAEDLYYGITTQVLKVETTRLDESAGEAEFMVQAQRNESRGVATNSRLYPQQAIVNMYKNTGLWLIGAVYWQ